MFKVWVKISLIILLVWGLFGFPADYTLAVLLIIFLTPISFLG